MFKKLRSLRGVFRKNDWIRWIAVGFGLIVACIDVIATGGGGGRVIGEDVGWAAKFGVIIGESALFDVANGRFFNIDVLLALTTIKFYFFIPI